MHPNFADAQTIEVNEMGLTQKVAATAKILKARIQEQLGKVIEMNRVNLARQAQAS